METRSINISVVIEQVDCATEYKITYEGPSGTEITAFTGMTTLEHNITGVEPETKYIIRTYANTGGGYELAETVVTTTLPNVAMSYDVTDFEEDGAFNLTSLDDTALSNISEVMDDLFDTGDIVNVSVSGKPNATSFINLGDSCGIKEVKALLLPFDKASGSGQNIDVILSDNTTTIPLVYDESSNTVSVDSVVYDAGDVFQLDGKKVTLAESTFSRQS